MIRLWNFADAPAAYRELPEVARSFADNPERQPLWLSHGPRSEPPSYLLAFLCKAWIEAFTGGWQGAVVFDLPDGTSVRVGWAKRRQP